MASQVESIEILLTLGTGVPPSTIFSLYSRLGTIDGFALEVWALVSMYISDQNRQGAMKMLKEPQELCDFSHSFDSSYSGRMESRYSRVVHVCSPVLMILLKHAASP